MNHSFDKLSALLTANETKLNLNEISIECENSINEASDNSTCSSTNKVKQKSKRFKVQKHIGETSCKTFSTSALLKIPNRISSKQNRFTCDQCPKTFDDKSNLERHKTMHTGEKPFQCDFCLKKFAKSYHLTEHKITHSGDKPYSCNLCPMKFAKSFNLIRHKRTHTGEKTHH